MKSPFSLPEIVILALISVGLILERADVDPKGICMNAGFGLMGIVGLIGALVGENRHSRFKGFLVAIPVLMIILSTKALLERQSDFAAIAVVLFIHGALLKRERTTSGDT